MSRAMNDRLRLKLYAQQDGLCWICGRAMRVDVPPAYHPDSATLDHVVPKSKGGGNDRNNLKLAHRTCNMRRSNDRS